MLKASHGHARAARNIRPNALDRNCKSQAYQATSQTYFWRSLLDLVFSSFIKALRQQNAHGLLHMSRSRCICDACPGQHKASRSQYSEPISNACSKDAMATLPLIT